MLPNLIKQWRLHTVRCCSPTLLAGSRTTVENGCFSAQGTLPCRFNSVLQKYKGGLYCYGGVPVSCYWPLQPGQPVTKPCYSDKEHFMVRYDLDTGKWEPVSFRGAPRESWLGGYQRAKGQTFSSWRWRPILSSSLQNTCRLQDTTTWHLDVLLLSRCHAPASIHFGSLAWLYDAASSYDLTTGDIMHIVCRCIAWRQAVHCKPCYIYIR